MCHCCFLPPYILKEIIRNGTAKQRDSALKTLSYSEQTTARRALITELTVVNSAEPVAGKKRAVYTARGTTQTPGRILRTEGQSPTGDTAVDEAYDAAGITYDFYKDVFGRDSIDGRGMQLVSTTHYGKRYSNAFWDGRAMSYGDGDGTVFGRFTKSVEVIGHELTHGVTQYTARLVYQDQPGALNESMSDVFGEMIEQKSKNQTVDQADWLVGEDLLIPGIHGKALRSMSEPGTAYDDRLLGKDPQPNHMSKYLQTDEDNGGVHCNSGICNRAFYLAATQIGGYSWSITGKIWFLALSKKLKPMSNFADAAKATCDAAGELYGVGKAEQEAVRAGWEIVGIPI